MLPTARILSDKSDFLGLCQTVMTDRLLLLWSTLASFPDSHTAVTIQWTGLLDWTTGLDYWTHGNCLWGRLNEQQTMHRAKTPSHRTCSSVVVAHLVPSHPAFFVSGREPGREPGRGYISTPPTSANAHYELHVESVCVGCGILEWLDVHYLSLLLSSSTSARLTWCC